MKIQTNKLRANDYNPNQMTKDEFKEFVSEVQHLKRLPKPIVVLPDYTIIDGEHAWRAAQKIGLKKVECEILSVDNFEAMRQTYKRNQHGTHNKILLGRMFKRMQKEKNLSIRKLAKQIEISESAIRTAFMYTRAVKLRKAYARDDDVESEIADLSGYQINLYNHLPEIIANLWLDDGGDPSRLYEPICHHVKGRLREAEMQRINRDYAISTDG